MQSLSCTLTKIAESCSGQTLNLESNISVLIFLEIGFHLRQANKKYEEDASKLLLNGE